MKKDIQKVVEPNSKLIRWFFFWTGIIATIAYRIIVVLNIYSPIWVKIAWYIGTIGFILYFGHRFSIARKRANLVEDYDLVKAVDKSAIDEDQRTALHYLVQTSLTSKSRWNSGFIFILSFLALIVGIVLDIYGF